MFNTLNISFYSFCHYKTTRSVFLTTAADPLLIFRMTPNGNHMLRLLTHS